MTERWEVQEHIHFTCSCDENLGDVIGNEITNLYVFGVTNERMCLAFCALPLVFEGRRVQKQENNGLFYRFPEGNDIIFQHRM